LPDSPASLVPGCRRVSPCLTLFKISSLWNDLFIYENTGDEHLDTPNKLFSQIAQERRSIMTMILATLMFLSVIYHNAMAFAPKFRSGVRRPSAVATLFATRVAPPRRDISDEVLTLFNSQVTQELAASQLYLSASIWCDQRDLIGMASFVSGYLELSSVSSLV
jgi:hypothetical protein